MARIAFSLLLSALLGFAGDCLQGLPAQAQLSRTYVSAATGSNANNCDRPTPCRTFQVAHDNTLANGEIVVLDPGGYGAVTITKTISIVNDGVGEAGMLVSGGGNGITINGAAADAVSLRGLTITGIGFGGGNGIVFNSGKSLTIENCAVMGSNQLVSGIVFQPIASSNFAVSNTLVADTQVDGVEVLPIGAGNVTAVLNEVESYNNAAAGIYVGASGGITLVTIVDSVSVNNLAGLQAASTPSQGSTNVGVAGSVLAYNNAGVVVQEAKTDVRMGASIVTGNATSWFTSNGGVFLSYGDNYVDGNASEPAMTLTAQH
jgi:hypothetical protein